MDLVSPLHTDSDAMLIKFRSIVRDEITQASRMLSSDFVRGLKEINHLTNQLEQRMDLTTTVLEGHEEEVEKLPAELEALQNKLEDTENRARRYNLIIRGIPENVRPTGYSNCLLPRTGTWVTTTETGISLHP